MYSCVTEKYSKLRPSEVDYIKKKIFKPYNATEHSFEWNSLNENQIINERQTQCLSHNSSQLKVGLNLISKRLFILNGKIPFAWLNLAIDSFKIKCKELFL